MFIGNSPKDVQIGSDLKVLLRERRALDVFDSTDFAGQSSGGVDADGLFATLSQFNEHFDVVFEITLSADQNERRFIAVAFDLWQPFLLNIVERRRTDHTEAEQEDRGLRVAQGPEGVEVVLRSIIGYNWVTIECTVSALSSPQTIGIASETMQTLANFFGTSLPERRKVITQVSDIVWHCLSQYKQLL